MSPPPRGRPPHNSGLLSSRHFPPFPNSFWASDSTLPQHIVALSPEDYGTYANPNDSPVCGRKIRIHGANGKSTVAKVADRCAGCTGHNIDVMPIVFTALGFATAEGRVDASWEWV